MRINYSTSGANNDGMYALDANSGTVLWHALRAETGVLLWRFTGYSGVFATVSPVVVNGVVYVGTDAGIIYALRAHDGSLLWSHTNGRSALGPLIVTDGTVQVSTQGNN